MSRCTFLDYESNSYFGNCNDKYKCELTCLKMDVDDSKVNLRVRLIVEIIIQIVKLIKILNSIKNFA